MSELLTQWSGILAYLGDEGFRDGFNDIDYSKAPRLKSKQLMAVNEKLVKFVESLDTHPDEKEELLEMMREFDSEAAEMHGGKTKRKSKKSRRTRRK
jgi:hypothetical protein